MKRAYDQHAVASVFALIVLTLFASPSRAATLNAVLSTNTVHVGDRVTLTVTAVHSDDQRVTVEPIQREPFITVWDMQTETEDVKPGEKSTVHTVVFSSFVVGQHRVATNNAVVMNADGTDEYIPIPELLLNVASVLSNPPPALADIKPAMKLPRNMSWRIFWMTLLVIAVALLGAWLIRAWLRKPKAAPSVRILPPHEIALSALQALLQRHYIENGDSQSFYVELSAIVRVYLEERFELRAPEQTTEEFIRSSSDSSSLSPDHRMLTQAFLEQSDLVKFARFQPSSDDMRAAWDAAARLVRETTPAPVHNPGGTP